MSNTTIHHFTDLIAWQKNHELVLKIYKITKNFPKEELFGLISQMRRAASSITANIAEGYGRFHSKDRIRFYLQSRGSSAELQNHLILAHDLKYLNDQEFEELKIISFEGYKIICGLINSTAI
ncbi:MAG: four helix bundle protein [Patescibacteria group bacterium]|nr:four helix bundle protein [Patescibacteria group bacterium]MDD4611194.1 four helix bundle protein [Patescibacteria group bacterium]